MDCCGGLVEILNDWLIFMLFCRFLGSFSGWLVDVQGDWLIFMLFARLLG